MKKRPLEMQAQKDNHTLDPYEAEKLVETWFKCPPGSLVNMFYTYHLDTAQNRFVNQRAITYKLSSNPDSMAKLMAAYGKAHKAGKTCALRVFMGCNDQYEANEIMKNNPAFTPFVQLIILEDFPYTNPFEYCYKCDWKESATYSLNAGDYYDPNKGVQSTGKPTGIEVNVPQGANASHVSPKTAHLFLEEWCQCTNNDLEGLFYGVVFGQIARVNGYTFLEADLNEIYNKYQSDPNQTIYLHLAVIKPNLKTPFNFHIVLEANGNAEKGNMMPAPSNDNEGTFYEFGFPCPPYCGDKPGGGGSAVTQREGITEVKSRKK